MFLFKADYLIKIYLMKRGFGRFSQYFLILSPIKSFSALILTVF